MALQKANLEVNDMKRTYEKKSAQPLTSVKPTTLNLQTRGFAPPQTNLDEEIPRQAKGSTSENLLEKLISNPNSDSATEPIQRKSQNRLKASQTKISTPIQAKLNIGEPNDKYEQEADDTASKVVQQINSTSQDSSVQRQELEEDELQMKPAISRIQRDATMEDDELQMKSLVQRRENLGGGEASEDLESSIQSARGSGQSLDPTLQAKMGQAMGADFSGVKVHTDSQSDQLNKSIQAKAFTAGQDVFFRQGAYEPSNKGGQELIAHELTHVVQQSQKQQISKSPDIQRKFAFNFKANVGRRHQNKWNTHNGMFYDLKYKYEMYQKAPDSEDGVCLESMLESIERYKQTDDYKKPNPTLKKRDVDRLEQVIIAEQHKVEFLSLMKDGKKPNDKQPKNPAKLLGKGLGSSGTVVVGKETKKIEDILKAKKSDSKIDGQGLDEAELLAIMLYTAQHYKYINPALVGDMNWLKAVNGSGPSSEIDNLAQVTKQGNLLGSMALSGLNKLKSEKRTLYRGEVCPEDKMKDRGHTKGKYPINFIISCAEAADDEKGKNKAFNLMAGLNSSQLSMGNAIIISKISAEDAVNIQDMHVSGKSEKEWNIKPGGTKEVTSCNKRKKGHIVFGGVIPIYDVEWKETRK